MSKVPVSQRRFSAKSLVALPTGRLLVTDGNSTGLYVLDPVTGHTELVAGRRGSVSVGSVDGVGRDARFRHLTSLIVVDEERCVYVCDDRLRRVTLPQHLFQQR